MKSKVKRQRRRYDKISLHYINLADDPPETYWEWKEIIRDLDGCDAMEDWRALRIRGLGLRLEINGTVVWSTCLISELVDIALGRASHPHGASGSVTVENIEHGSADYWPFVCFDCGYDGCAGVFVPLRVFQRGKEIILGLRRPLGGVKPDEKSCIRAYRLRRRDFLDALINAVKFRLALENMIIRLTDGNKSGDCLMDIFGLSCNGDYQRQISQRLRDDYPLLLDLRLTLSEKISRTTGNNDASPSFLLPRLE